MIEFRTLKHVELEAWFEHCTLVFGNGSLDPTLYRIFERSWYCDPCRDLETILVAVEDDRILSGVHIHKMSVYLQGQVVPMGGIASVSTRPEARCRGISSRLLEIAIQHMQALAMPISLLETGVHAHYAKLGWITLPLYTKSLRVNYALLEIGQVRPVDFDRDIPSLDRLHAAYTGRLNGTLVRGMDHWPRFSDNAPGNWWGTEDQGRLVAYLCINNREDGLSIEEFGALPDYESLFDSFVVQVLHQKALSLEKIACPGVIRSQFEFLDWIQQNDWMARLNLPFEVGERRLESTSQLIELLSVRPDGETGKNGSFTFWGNDDF